MSEYVLEIRDLSICFYSGRKEIPAVENLSFNLSRGETLGIVGESGSGKTVTSLSIMKLIPNPPGKITGGEMFFGSLAGFIVLYINSFYLFVY
jgi:ABC-type dipeptide/oligopeptide/nickel transport system ATPase component